MTAKEASAPAKVKRKSRSAIPADSILERLFDFAFSIPDFRRTGRGNHRHGLGDIILLLIFARMSKCVGRADIIRFGKCNLKKLQALGILMSGVPSEATLCRIENGLDELDLAQRMADFCAEFDKELVRSCERMEMICIDGKAMRETVQENGRNPDIVSAYSFTTGVVLATEACSEKSNEIKAVPLLIDKIDVKGKVVTADAMSMQKDIVDLIVSKEGYFLIELKANQPSMRYGIEDNIKGA